MSNCSHAGCESLATWLVSAIDLVYLFACDPHVGAMLIEYRRCYHQVKPGSELILQVQTLE